jgi:hypothetical protein
MKTTCSPRMMLACFSLVLIGCDQPQKKQEAPVVIETKKTEQKSDTEASDEPSDQYYRAYLLTREAEREVDRDQALQKLQKALDEFQAIKIKFPDWKPKMVDGRIELMHQMIAKKKAQSPAEGTRYD